MEKEMLVHLKIKEGKLETFMGWMQSDEGMGVRKSVAYPEKTVGACLLYTSPSPRDLWISRMPSSA